MKLLEIKKKFRHATVTHHMFFDDNVEDWYVEECVRDWAEREGSGQNYGYKVDYKFVKNKELLNDLIEKRIKVIKTQLHALLNEGEKLESYLNNNNR